VPKLSSRWDWMSRWHCYHVNSWVPMTLTLGIALALGCALTTNLGFLYKHRGACAAPEVDFRRPVTSAKQLFSSKLFAIGMGIAVVSWIFHVAAMAMVPLSVVQAVLAGGIVMLAIMAERALGVRIGRRQWAGLGMTAIGLVLLGVSLPAVHGAHSQFSVPGMIAFEAGLIAVGTLLIMGPRIGAPRHQHGVMLGAASGILFGVSDVAIKALTGMIAAHGLMGLASPWLIVTVAASIVAFFSSAKGLQDGQAVPVIAVTSTAANVSGIVGGLVVFGDPLPSSAFGIAVQVMAFTLVIVAAWLTPAPARAAATLA
jgi:drug/metabolite transporter (DMT)-like permease